MNREARCRMKWWHAMLLGSPLASAVPFSFPQALPDAAESPWASGGTPVRALCPILRNGTQGVAALEADRLVFHPAPGGTAQLIDPDLPGGSAVAALDGNRDGREDLVAASRVRRELYFYAQSADGSFAVRQTLATGLDSVTAFTVAKLDGDAYQDLIGITDHDRRMFALRVGISGLAAMEVLFRASAPLSAIASGDLDGNGVDEILVAHGSQILTLSASAGTYSVSSVTDMEADRLLLQRPQTGAAFVLLASHAVSGELRIYQPGDGFTWENPASLPAAARDFHMRDLDGDGDADIVFADRITGELKWMEQSGTTAFHAPAPLGGTLASIPATVDLDADGQVDLVVADARKKQKSLLSSYAEKPYLRWASDYPLDASQAADADADGDGQANLVAYALGTDPLDGNPDGTHLLRDASGIRFTFSRKTSPPAHGLTYELEISDNLLDWQPADTAEMLTAPQSPGWEQVTLPLSGSRRFARLRLQYADP